MRTHKTFATRRRVNYPNATAFSPGLPRPLMSQPGSGVPHGRVQERGLQAQRLQQLAMRAQELQQRVVQPPYLEPVYEPSWIKGPPK